MEDYPRDLLEFEARFASEGACRDYLSALRWPEGFRCPGCGHERAWPVCKVCFECARCGRQTSVTCGTIFQDTRKPREVAERQGRSGVGRGAAGAAERLDQTRSEGWTGEERRFERESSAKNVAPRPWLAYTVSAGMAKTEILAKMSSPRVVSSRSSPQAIIIIQSVRRVARYQE